MDIHWYPGHMTKTRRMIQADLKLVDLVAEVIDARIPISSRNPDIDELVGDKPRPIRNRPGPGPAGLRQEAAPSWRPTARRGAG